MKQVTLRGEDFRRWRTNRMALVLADDGKFVRFASDAESNRISMAATSNTPLTLKLKDGRKLTPISDRDRMCAEIQAAHPGEKVMLKLPNGKYLKALRPLNAVPAPLPDPTTSMVAPHPSNCTCAQWKGRVDGKHHPLCEWNQHAPPEQRGDIGADVLDVSEEGPPMPQPQLQPKPRKPTAETLTIDEPSDVTFEEGGSQAVMPPGTTGQIIPPPTATPDPASNMPKPSECRCQDFPPFGDGRVDIHHEMCEWRPYWVERYGDGTPPLIPNPPQEPVEIVEKGEASAKPLAETVEEANGKVEEETHTAGPEEPTSPEVPAPDPADCQCRQWELPEGESNEHHHPFCPHKKRWMKTHVKVKRFVLQTLSGENLREAHGNEVEAAAAQLEKTGTPTVFVDDVEYVVVKADD